MAQIRRSTYSARDRNWKVSPDKIVFCYPGISRLLELTKFGSPPQRLEGNNESPVFVDVSGCVAVVAHRNFCHEVEHSSLCQIDFVLIDIAFVLTNMPP